MKFKFNEGRMFADIDEGMCVIIDSETGTYFGMDEESSTMFKMVCESKIEDIVNLIKNKYNKDVFADLSLFVKDLVEKNILVEDDSQNSEEPKEINLTAFNWKCESYTDAQDLILADPIHDVPEDEGWSPVIK